MAFILDLKSDFSKIEHIFTTFFKKAPSWAAVAETDLAFIAPIINSLVVLNGGASVEPDVNAVLVKIQKDLVLATKFVQAEDSSANLTDVLSNISSNLSGLLTIAAVKNSSKITEITAYVNGVIGEINAIIAALPAVA